MKGTRVGIETILYEYIHRARTPEEIANIYTSLTLEQIYATILYYLHNKEAVSAYIADWLEWSHRMQEEQRRNPPPVVIKLKKLKAERDAQDLRTSYGITNRRGAEATEKSEFERYFA